MPAVEEPISDCAGTAPKTWCFFELDGTLIRKDSYVPFLLGWMCKRPSRLWRLCAIPFLGLYARLLRKDPSYMKEALLRLCLRGAWRSQLDAYVPQFWDAFLPLYQNDELISRLIWHHENGHFVYLVTSSFDFYVNQLAYVWPIDGVIATRAEWHDDVLTGAIKGRDCRGVEKMERISRELGLDIQHVAYYAYSHQEADLPLLMNTKYGFLVKAAKLGPWEMRQE